METSASEITPQGRSGRIVRLATLVLAGLALAISVAIAWLANWVGFYDAPYGDTWHWIDRLGTLDDFFARNYDHPVALARIVFWLDYHLFDARGRFVQLVTIVTMAAQVPALVWLARQAGVKSTGVIALVAAALVLAVNGWENPLNPFNVTYTPIYAFAPWAFAALGAHLAQPRMWTLALCFAMTAGALLSAANGVFVPTLLAAMALVGRHIRIALAMAVIAVVGWALQLAVDTGVDSFKWVAPITVPNILQYFITLLGAPATHPFTPLPGSHDGDTGVAFVAGLVVFAISAGGLAWIALWQRKNPALLALAGVIAFCVLTAALTAAARFILGVHLALSSRYYANSALLWAALVVLVVYVAARIGEARPGLRMPLQIAAPVSAAVLAALLATGVQVLGTVYGFHRAFQYGVTSAVTGVEDSEALWYVRGWLQTKELGDAGTATLRAAGKSMFADPVTRRLGEQVAGREAAPPCGTGSWSTREGLGFRGARGEFARTTAGAGANHVVIADAAGTMIGYGLVPRRPSDLNPLARADGRSVDWYGHLRDAPGPFTAYLSTGTQVRCALGPASPE